jgi:hypothetical protein
MNSIGEKVELTPKWTTTYIRETGLVRLIYVNWHSHPDHDLFVNYTALSEDDQANEYVQGVDLFDTKIAAIETGIKILEEKFLFFYNSSFLTGERILNLKEEKTKIIVEVTDHAIKKFGEALRKLAD